MSRYPITLIAALIMMGGCSVKNPAPEQKPPVAVGKKVFVEEDELIIKALYYLQQGNIAESASLFGGLYDKTDNTIYALEQIKLLIDQNEYNMAISKAQEVLTKHPKEAKLYRLLALAYFQNKDLKNAKGVMQKALDLSKKIEDYDFLSSLYMAEKDYEMALKYLQSAYKISADEKILDKMSNIMFLFLNQKREAVSYLETHSRMYGCSRLICLRLAAMYGALGDTDGMISVYKRLYETFGEEEFAKKVVELLLYRQNFIQAAAFLEKSGTDDDTLLAIYVRQKEYIKAKTLAQKLYEKSGNIRYLADSAIYEYEAAKDKKDRTVLSSVIAKLDEVIKKEKDAVYLNYLGYLLIDHDLDVARGIELVKEALKQESDSPYYMDSLAWGYYKLGRCQEAQELMQKVIERLGLDDEEVKAHMEAIKKCLQGNNQ